jgi:hypothetical protein
MEMNGQHQLPTALNPCKNPCIYSDWVGLRTELDFWRRKFSFTFQSLVSTPTTLFQLIKKRNKERTATKNVQIIKVFVTDNINCLFLVDFIKPYFIDDFHCFKKLSESQSRSL